MAEVVARKWEHQPTRYDWDELRREYVTSNPEVALVSLARRHGVSHVSVHKWHKRQKWLKERVKFWQDVHATAIAEAKASAVLSCVARFQRLRRLIDNAIDELSTKYTHNGAQHLLRLLDIEREVLADVPLDRSRERILREHVERALNLAGIPLQPPLEQETEDGTT